MIDLRALPVPDQVAWVRVRLGCLPDALILLTPEARRWWMPGRCLTEP